MAAKKTARTAAGAADIGLDVVEEEGMGAFVEVADLVDDLETSAAEAGTDLALTPSAAIPGPLFQRPPGANNLPMIDQLIEQLAHYPNELVTVEAVITRGGKVTAFLIRDHAPVQGFIGDEIESHSTPTSRPITNREKFAKRVSSVRSSVATFRILVGHTGSLSGWTLAQDARVEGSFQQDHGHA